VEFLKEKKCENIEQSGEEINEWNRDCTRATF
jgi:hypothetical protein